MGESNNSGSNNNGGCGCFSLIGVIVTVFVIWGLIFGVTVSGKHYGVGCSCSKGVEVSP